MKYNANGEVEEDDGKNDNTFVTNNGGGQPG
jgi:hypothetical protein